MKRFNPLKKYDQYLDVIDFLETNIARTTKSFCVPIASSCYFVAPLFKKHKFILNFEQLEPYYFWNIYKKNKFIFPQVLDEFRYLNNQGSLPEIEKIMHEEESGILKSALYLLLCRQHKSIKDYGISYDCDWDSNFEKGFRDSLYKLDLSKTDLMLEGELDKSLFFIQSMIDDFSLAPDRVELLNSFKTGMIITNNINTLNYYDYDEKIDFKDCYILLKIGSKNES